MTFTEALVGVTGGLVGLAAWMAALGWFIVCLDEGEWVQAGIAFIVLILVTTTIIWLIANGQEPTELPVR